MKEWQKGIDLEILKEYEKVYTQYNSYTLSPFAKYKKNDIARDIDNKTFTQWYCDSWKKDPTPIYFTKSECKVKSPINMYQNVVIGEKKKGDIVYAHFSDVPDGYDFVDRTKDSWFFFWAEDVRFTTWLLNAPREWSISLVGQKITTFGEIYSVVFLEKKTAFAKHPFKPISFEEHIACQKLGDVDINQINKIRFKLAELAPSFTNHYSQYNSAKSWSALSLRGYTKDPAFITKPIEMSDKWKEENKNIHFELQDTPLYKEFPNVKDMLESMFDGDIHRVRFMKLSPGGGELKRHTDQVDPDSGNGLGKLVRIHFPIKTNDKVEFTTWNYGRKETVNMKEGEFWMLDTRKPHTVINNGDTERIHLVVDVTVTYRLLDMMRERQ